MAITKSSIDKYPRNESQDNDRQGKYYSFPIQVNTVTVEHPSNTPANNKDV